MTVNAIIFDKDGVLVDFDRSWIAVLVDIARALSRNEAHWRQLLDLAGYNFETGRFVSGSVWAAGNNRDLVDLWAPLVDGVTRQELGAFIVEKCAECEPVPQVDLQNLRALFAALVTDGVALAIATNDAEASAVRTMERFGLLPFLSQIMGYDSVASPKPSPQPVELFCREHNIAAGDVAVVGDNVHDMEMARSAGAGLKIGVLSGNSSRADLTPHADHLIDDVLALPQLLSGLNLVEMKESQINVL